MSLALILTITFFFYMLYCSTNRWELNGSKYDKFFKNSIYSIEANVIFSLIVGTLLSRYWLSGVIIALTIGFITRLAQLNTFLYEHHLRLIKLSELNESSKYVNSVLSVTNLMVVRGFITADEIFIDRDDLIKRIHGYKEEIYKYRDYCYAGIVVFLVSLFYVYFNYDDLRPKIIERTENLSYMERCPEEYYDECWEQQELARPEYEWDPTVR